ncbi:MAG: leucyl aminopeptidase family protein, partial [bacterium]
MNITFENKNDLTIKTDVLILPVFGTNRSPLFVEIDRSLNGLLKDVLRKKPSLSQKGAELVHVSGKPQKAVLLVGIGDFRKATAETLRKAGGSASGSLREYELKKVSLSVKDLVQHGLDYFSFLDGFLLNRYLFTKYKTKPEKIYDGELTVLAAGTRNDLARLKWGMNLAEAVHVARDLINSPANDITPSALAGIARGLAKGKVSVRVFGANEIRKLGMNAFYAVAKGSSEEPRLIVLNYSGRKDSPLIALVGKSVTFDSGGLSIKPSEGMEKMKYDMAGGAAVLAVMQTV